MKNNKKIKRPMDISNGTRMNWLMKKTGYKKSRETVPLRPHLMRALRMHLESALTSVSMRKSVWLWTRVLRRECFLPCLSWNSVRIPPTFCVPTVRDGSGLAIPLVTKKKGGLCGKVVNSGGGSLYRVVLFRVYCAYRLNKREHY